MDLHFLTDVLDRPGPFATVYLDISHDTEDAAQQDTLRRRAAREELAGLGADEDTLDALDRAMDSPPDGGGRGRVLVAAAGQVRLDQVLPSRPEPAPVSWAPLPDLLPMLLALPEPVTAVVVRVDETGGEIMRRGTAGIVDGERVRGGRRPVHKVAVGGLSDLAGQERVEENWRRNVAELAGRVDAHVSESGARVLVLAGDGPSRSRLRDALSERAAAIAVDVPRTGGTAERGGTDREDLAAAVDEAVLDVVDARRHAVLDHYQQAARQQQGYAVDGLDAVLAALRAEQVEVLLLDGTVGRDTPVWFAEQAPSQVATDDATLRDLGSEPHGPAAADAALIRAAAAGGAAFHPLGGGRTGLVGHDVTHGVAALLRHPFVGT